MEAKDTVMSDREIKSVLLEVADRYYDAEIQVTVSHTALAQTQAEISFKFGYEQGLREQGSPRADAEIRLADEEYAREFRKEWIEDNKELDIFKAGREQEKQEWLMKTDPEKARDNFTRQIIERAYAQGRREVVGWVNLNSVEPKLKVKYLDGVEALVLSSMLWLDKPSWQAFLKEKDIE